MMYPTRRVLGLTWVGWLNFLLLQWLGVRLTGRYDPAPAPAWGAWLGWGIQGPILPLTGWWGRYLPRNPWMWPL